MILSQLVTRLVPATGIWVIAISTLSAQTSKTPDYDPTCLKTATFSKPANGGVWHDLWFATDLDSMMGRRKAQVFELNDSVIEPKTVGKFNSLKDSKVIKTVNSTSGLWLIAESKRLVPFAINLKTRKQLNFTIDGLAVPGERTPTIQSWVYVSKSQSALLMISGGDRATWPLDGNHPVYYCVNFGTGRAEMMPIGSDLYYFSADQSVAVFSNGGTGKQFAIRMDTAEEVEQYPNNRTTDNVPFRWTNRDFAKPLINADYQFVGLSARGTAYPLSIVLDSPYISSIKINQNAALIFMRGHGAPRNSSEHALWHTELKANAKPRHLENDVLDFQVLENGLCIYQSRHFGVKKRSEEAFCYAPNSGEKHNLLDGIERLEPLAADVAELSYAVDVQKIQIVTPVHYTTAPTAALCLFDHRQSDGRVFALVKGQGAPVPKIERKQRRTGIYLNASAERFHIKQIPDNVLYAGARWLNSTGNVFIGRSVWVGDAETGKRELRLHSSQLQFGD